MGLPLVNNLYYDPQSGQYFDRPNRFKSTYEPIPYEGQNVLRAFEVMSYVPVVGAPFNVVLGIGAIQEGHPFLGSLQIIGGFADAAAIAEAANAAKGGYALWKAGQVATSDAGGKVIATASHGNPFLPSLSHSDLSKQIRTIDARLPQPGSTAFFHKNEVSMRQLLTLTNYTGDEYQMFTKGGQRLVIRGADNEVVVSHQMYQDILSGKYGRYSGHTHPPGVSLNPGREDRPFLQAIGQKQSGIWGTAGVKTFEAGKSLGAGWLP